MSRLSYDPYAINDRKSQNRQSFAARRRASLDARQARIDAKRAQAQQRQLQADAAHQAERQMIMQANLQAQAASGQMYAQQQNAARLGRSKMADDTTLRQRNRQDAIFNKRQLMDQGWNQNQIDTQQAAIQHALDARMRRLDHQSQMKRDKAQHGYGQGDARLQNKFNVGMEELQHGNTQARDMTQHGYSLARDQQQHGYGQEDARLQQQFAEQNFTDEMIEERTQGGWTRSPGQQREWDTLDEERNKAIRLRRQGKISETDLNKMLGEIHNAKRELIPDLPPPQAQRMTQDEAKGSTWIDESTGALMTQDADGFPIKLGDAPRESGSTGKADDGMGQYLPPAQLAFDKMVMDRWNSQPDKYDAEGNVKGKEFTEAQIRERLLKQYPQMRQFYIEEVPGPTAGPVNEPVTESVLSPQERLFLSQGALNDQEQAAIKELQERRTPKGEAVKAMQDEGKVIASKVGDLMQAPWVRQAFAINPGAARDYVMELRNSLIDMAKMMQDGIEPAEKVFERQEELRSLIKGIKPATAPNEHLERTKYMNPRIR